MITDEEVDRRYGEEMFVILRKQMACQKSCGAKRRAGQIHRHVHKTADVKRFDFILTAPHASSLGGGVVGDLAGFVASTFMRGIDYHPNAQRLCLSHDSAVGGKVAMNHPLGKNLNRRVFISRKRCSMIQNA